MLTVYVAPRAGLGVHAHDVFRTTRADERPTTLILAHELVELSLQARRADKPTLRILRLEHVAVRHGDLDETVRQVSVERVPLLAGVRAVRKDSLNKQHVRHGIADGLVDKFCQAKQMLQACRVRGRARLVRAQCLEARGRKKHGAVPVRLEVDADGEVLRRVVQVLDACRDAPHRNALVNA